MDTKPDYERLKDVLRDQPEGSDLNEAIVEVCSKGYTDLLQSIRDSNLYKKNYTRCFSAACIHGATDVVKILLQTGLEGRIFHKFCLAAAQHGHVDILKLLVTDRRVIYADLIEVLGIAAEHNQIKILRFLSAEMKESDVEEAFEMAAKKNHIGTYRNLLSYTNHDLPRNILSELYSGACYANDIDFVETMLNVVKDDSFVDIDLICKLGNIDFAKAVLQHPNCKRQFLNEKELRTAAQHGNLEFLKEFLTGPMIPANIKLRYVLEAAINEGHYDIVQFLLGLENPRLDEEEIALGIHAACLKYSFLITRMLLSDKRCNLTLVHEKLSSDKWSSEFLRNVKETSDDIKGDTPTIEMLDKMISCIRPTDENAKNNSYIYTKAFIYDAGASGNLELIKSMIERGLMAEVEASGVMEVACLKGHAHVAEFLVQRKLGRSEYGYCFCSGEKLFNNLLAARTLYSVAVESSASNYEYVLPSLVRLRDTKLFRSALDFCQNDISKNFVEALFETTNKECSYEIYKMLLEIYPDPGQIGGIVSMVPLFESIIYAEAGRMDMISDDISKEDLDIIICRARESKNNAIDPSALQIEYIKKHHNFVFRDGTCNYTTGSDDCRKYIKTIQWPVIESVAFYLKLLKPMKTATLEAIMMHMVWLHTDMQWTEEQLEIISRGLGNYELD